MIDFSALAGAGVFLLRKKKGTKEIRPITTCPKKRASLSFQLCQRVGLTRNPARRPQFAVHGKLPLPKSKSDAGCTGWGKAEIKNQKMLFNMFL